MGVEERVKESNPPQLHHKLKAECTRRLCGEGIPEASAGNLPFDGADVVNKVGVDVKLLFNYVK